MEAKLGILRGSGSPLLVGAGIPNSYPIETALIEGGLSTS